MEFVTIIRINSSYLLNALSWAPKINLSPGHLLYHLWYLNVLTYSNKALDDVSILCLKSDPKVAFVSLFGSFFAQI